VPSAVPSTVLLLVFLKLYPQLVTGFVPMCVRAWGGGAQGRGLLGLLEVPRG